MSSNHPRTGPTTVEGKARVGRNAVRHGLLAKQILIGKESPAAFTALFDLLIAHWAPVNEIELGHLEEMASAYWRLRRAWAIEAEMLKAAMADQPARRQIARAAAAFAELAAGPSLGLLHRYETRLHLVYQRALHNFLLLRQVDVPNKYNNSLVSNESMDFDPSNIADLASKTAVSAPKKPAKRSIGCVRLLLPPPDPSPKEPSPSPSAAPSPNSQPSDIIEVRPPKVA